MPIRSIRFPRSDERDPITGQRMGQAKHQVSRSKEAPENFDDAAHPQWNFSIGILERGSIDGFCCLEEFSALLVKLVS